MTHTADRDPFAELYGRIGLSGAGTDNTCLAHVAAGPVTVDEVVLVHTRNVNAPPSAALCLRFPQLLTRAVEPRGTHVTVPNGHLTLACHPGLPHQYDESSSAGALLDAYVVGAARPQPPPPRERLRTEHRPVDPAAADQLRATVGCLGHVLDLAAEVGATTLLYDSSARLLAMSLLACMPRDAGAPALDGGGRHPTTLQLAMDYIGRHADQPLTLGDIAAAAHVTPRAVQYAFAQLGTTPLAHLRQVRLAGAHAELEAADPTTGTVTDIAMRWGFNHPGHFAAHYRGVYGTTPSTTLNAHGPAPEPQTTPDG